ncbi:arginyltransferase [Aliikangiella marina]|uniref:Aspartate/glutamate leucyltransferase n=1 Tax=Aliikangiella marina TaxID=1712262 RepID=A0A545TK02_9GAMM|nr:arginyltransferase [Aliikangiella marina]TQV77516.1 arginyltransferase [Aliikangiella marina]
MSSQFKPIPLSFFITPPHNCPYLKDQQSKTIFLSPEVQTNTIIYSALLEKGFRRSGEHIYRPQCENCNACISVRIPTDQFKMTRSQKRVYKKLSHFTTKTEPAHFNQQHFQLFDKYISTRHRDGDMYPTSTHQYQDFLLCDWLECNYLNFWDISTQKLVATCVYDVVSDGLSAVYTYFDPDYEKFSLGKLAILKLIDIAAKRNLPYVYLGYWIKESQKMSYKGDYRPLECFVNDKWITLN